MGLLFGWRGRVRRWPRLDPDGSPWDMEAGPGDIKVVSTEALEHLTEKAQKTLGVSAVGRPEWLEVHRVASRPLHRGVGAAGARGYYRCIVVSVLSDGPAGAYTLDVTERDFHALRDVSPNHSWWSSLIDT